MSMITDLLLVTSTAIIGWSIIIGSIIAIQSMISASKAKKKEQEELAAIKAEREKDEFYYQRKMDLLTCLLYTSPSPRD